MTIEETRKMLPYTKGMSDLEVQNIITTFELLAEGWLDTYERTVFNGKTINELVNKLKYKT